MEHLRYDRLCRTTQSEAYLLSDGEEPVARLDLHFTSTVVYGLLILERELGDQDVQELIEQIDEDIVWTAGLPRDDFVVTVYQGKEIGVYSDADHGEQEPNGSREPD